MWFLNNLAVIASIFAPLFCILIMLMKWPEFPRINRACLFRLLLASVFLSVLWAAPLELPKITSYLEIYVFFFGLFAWLLHKRQDWRRYENSFLFPTAGLMVFVAADIWEWPIFVYGNLGLFNPVFQASAGQWFDQIHRLYALAVFIALLIMVEWKANRRSLALLASAIIAPFLILAASGPSFPFWPELARIITLMFFGLSIIQGVDPD